MFYSHLRAGSPTEVKEINGAAKNTLQTQCMTENAQTLNKTEMCKTSICTWR